MNSPALDMHAVVIARLEDAGRTLAMLPMPVHGRPADLRAAWPDTTQQLLDWIGPAEEGTLAERMAALAEAHHRQRLHADQAAIARLDEVLVWLLGIDEVHWRRAVAARMLVHPVSERPMHSYGDIARRLGVDKRTVGRWYDSGVAAIVEKIACPERPECSIVLR